MKTAEKLVISLTEAEVIIPAVWAKQERQEALREAAKKHGVDMYLKLTPSGLVAGARPQPEDIG